MVSLNQASRNVVLSGAPGRASWGRRIGFGRCPHELPNPETIQVRSILLASEGRPIGTEAIALAARLARRCGASLHIISIARVWGTAFGFPNPGLMPTRAEWKTQRQLVADAREAVQAYGIDASCEVRSTRNASKIIVREAKRRGADVIIMTADAPRNRLAESLDWAAAPYRVRRRAVVPVYLLIGENAVHARAAE